MFSMTIRSVDLNGMMQRSQDVSTVKHQQDQRPVVEQQQIGIREEKKFDQKMHQVNQSAKKDGTQTKHDAKEEGRNKYFSNSNSNKKKKKEEVNKVIPKTYQGGFDIKI